MTKRSYRKKKNGAQKKAPPKPAEPRIDPRVTEALAKLDAALLCALSDTVGVPYTGGMSHNLAIAARAATDIRGILLLGGDES